MSFDLIYPAIIIFSLLVVGLVLTIMEFRKINEVEEEKRARQSEREQVQAVATGKAQGARP